jgi:hypothetical protein
MKGATAASVTAVLALLPAGSAAEVRVQVTNGLVELRSTADPVSDLLDALGAAVGMEVRYEGPRPVERISVSLAGCTPAAALMQVLEGLGLNYALRLGRSPGQVELLLITDREVARARGVTSSREAPPAVDAGVEVDEPPPVAPDPDALAEAGGDPPAPSPPTAQPGREGAAEPPRFLLPGVGASLSGGTPARSSGGTSPASPGFVSPSSPTPTSADPELSRPPGLGAMPSTSAPTPGAPPAGPPGGPAGATSTAGSSAVMPVILPGAGGSPPPGPLPNTVPTPSPSPQDSP